MHTLIMSTYSFTLTKYIKELVNVAFQREENHIPLLSLPSSKGVLPLRSSQYVL